MNSTNPNVHIVPPGEGDAYWTLGDLITFKVGPRQTNNQWSLAETVVQPGGGPPPHIHHREDETFFILDGEMELTLGDDVYLAKPGDAFFLPRGKVHTFHNPSKTKLAKMLVLATPCGFEKFMMNFARPRSQSAAPPPVRKEDVEKLIKVAPEFGIELKLDHKPKNAPKAVTCTQQSLWVIGNRVDLHLLSKDTNGSFLLATMTSEVGAGPPLHRHGREDELFYVFDGAFEFTVGDRKIIAQAGTTIFAPRGIWHTFKATGTTRAKFANFMFPAGFENFFIELGTERGNTEKPPMTPVDSVQIGDVFRKHGMEVRQ